MQAKKTQNLKTRIGEKLKTHFKTYTGQKIFENTHWKKDILKQTLEKRYLKRRTREKTF